MQYHAVECPNLSNPSNGRVDQRGNRPGDRASYTCDSGYELVGLSSRICQNNGQWSGDAPTCESKSFSITTECISLRFNVSIVRCPNLPNIPNGRVNQQGNSPGDRATYTCNSGYELDDESIRTCQNNGRWSGEAPTCEREGIKYGNFSLGACSFI